MHKVTLIPGDGTGPEVTNAAVKVIEASGAKIDYEVALAGEAVMKKEGTPLPEYVLDSCRKNKVALKGPITTPIGSGFRSVNVALRQALDLYACLRPAKSFEGIPSRYSGIDLVIVRENTEDLYAGIEFNKGTIEARTVISKIEEQSRRRIKDDSAISIKPISESASNKIVKFACEYAVNHQRKRVTAVHKANIMKATDGLFLECSRKIGAKYVDKNIVVDDCIVDNMCMQLVKNPEKFEVLVCPNLYGDIISDLCAGLIGGLGIAPGANIGEDYAACARFCAQVCRPGQG
jgi:isocitrate dehydrogenase (NAD+)